jgi:hypothetical protein
VAGQFNLKLALQTMQSTQWFFFTYNTMMRKPKNNDEYCVFADLMVFRLGCGVMQMYHGVMAAL